MRTSLAAPDLSAPERFETDKKRFESAIIAGPVVVPLPGQSGEYSIFVVVATGAKGPWAGYLSDCIVYELNESGKPIAMTQLPRTLGTLQAAEVRPPEQADGSCRWSPVRRRRRELT
jgi:hypothetical protein